MTGEWSGALKERVVLEQWLAAQDDAGADIGTWQRVATLWASVTPDGNGTPRDGEARRQRPRWLVSLRMPVTVTLQSRLVWRGIVLTVRSVESDPATPDRVRVRTEDRS